MTVSFYNGKAQSISGYAADDRLQITDDRLQMTAYR